MKHLIYLVLFAVPLLSSGAVANIDHIVFVSEPQTLQPGVISKVLTIQTQNAAFEMETLDETADLTVSVTSATGEFNSNSTAWNPAKTFTMSKGTGNKNFYYKDSTIGTYTVSATLTTRTAGKSWTATQEIVISDEPPGDDDTATTTTATSTATGGSSSTHYENEELSTYTGPKNVFDISAGRNRLGNLGSSLSFSAEYKISKDLENERCHFLWTFGDGSADDGDDVEHTYRYPGWYNLVLNGECGKTQAVSRATIEIVENNLRLELSALGDVVLTNSGEHEVNLYDWKLVSAKSEYTFPLDTIISSENTVIFPREYTNIQESWGIKLVNPAGKIVAEDEIGEFMDRYLNLTSD